MSFTLPSFAKINWALSVLGRRPDGFHEIETLLQTIDLKDEISFEVASSGISLRVEGRGAPETDDNLICRAARMLAEETGVQAGLRIRLNKQIPIGAGLGGGSSNAAVTLIAANHLWGCGLSLSALAMLAARLGSDVPFFLQGGTAFGYGRGEKVLSWGEGFPETSVLLLYPGFEVSAAEAYSAVRCGEISGSSELTIDQVEARILPFKEIVVARRWGALKNDLEVPVLGRFPVLGRMKQALLDVGCKSVMLSGSGSCLIGFGDCEPLELAAEKANAGGLGEVLICRTLGRVEFNSAYKTVGLPASGS